MPPLSERLRAMAAAYPIDVFPEPTREETTGKFPMISRVYAEARRSLAPMHIEAADALDAAERALSLLTEGDRGNAKEHFAGIAYAVEALQLIRRQA